MTARVPTARRECAPRIIEVLTCLSHGMDRKMTGRQLGLSPYTVADYMKAARQVLGARNRTHAVAIALRRGLIE